MPRRGRPAVQLTGRGDPAGQWAADWAGYADDGARPRPEGWGEYALGMNRALFLPVLSAWYRGNAARFLSALAGWLVVVRLHYLAALAAAARAGRGAALAGRLGEALRRRAELEGGDRALAGLGRPELRRLLADQRRAAEATAHLLAARTAAADAAGGEEGPDGAGLP